MATLRLGDTAPDSQQDSTEGPISFHQWAGDAWQLAHRFPKASAP